LVTSARRKPHQKTKEETGTISYRLPSKLLDDLETEAREKNISQNVLVKQILMKYVRWERFAQKMGIIHRANILTKNVKFNVKADIYYRLKRLLDRNEMGQIFKVIFFKKKGVKFNLGFK